MCIRDSAYVTQIDFRVNADTFAPNIMHLVDEGLWKVDREGEWITSEMKVDGKKVFAKYKFMVYKPVR